MCVWIGEGGKGRRGREGGRARFSEFSSIIKNDIRRETPSAIGQADITWWLVRGERGGRKVTCSARKREGGDRKSRMDDNVCIANNILFFLSRHV